MGASVVRVGMGPAAAGALGEARVVEFEKILGASIGAEVEVVLSVNYRQLLSDIDTGALQFAWLPPAVFIRAFDRGGVTLLVSTVRSKGVRYHGTLFVKASRALSEPNELHKQRVAWVDPSSCGGFLFPRLGLLERGLDPRGFFRSEVFVGSHAAVVEAVDTGDVDVGATYMNLDDGETVMAAGFTDHPPDEEVRTVLVSRPIPSDVFCAVAGMDLGLEERVASALLGFHERPGAGDVLGLFGAKRFEKAELRNYDVVRAALNVTHSRIRRRR